jgi:hypothetical protein
MKRQNVPKEPESPETDITPYEDINTIQVGISGEKLPQVTLGMCDNCHWCYTTVNSKGILSNCPICNIKISQIPLNIDEVCTISLDEKRGLSIRFDRRLPIR